MDNLYQVWSSNTFASICMVLGVAFYLYVAYGIYRHFRHPKTVEPKGELPSLMQLEEIYGTPSDIIVLNATKYNQTDAVILAYDDAGFFIVNGEKIPMDEVSDVTFNNRSIPWESPEYQILIQTTMAAKDLICLSVGYDSEWAKNVTIQIRSHLGFNKSNQNNAY